MTEEERAMQQLRDQQEGASNIALLGILLNTTMNQVEMLKGQYKHQAKRFLNLFIEEGYRCIKELEKNVQRDKAGLEYLDWQSVFYWEVFNEALRSKDQRMFLAMCKAFNAGEVQEKKEEDPQPEREAT